MRKAFFWIIVSMGGVAFVIAAFTFDGTLSMQDIHSWISKEAQSAAVFFTASISVDQLQKEYNAGNTGKIAKASPREKYANGAIVPDGKVRILIVPGHQPDSGGTTYGGIQERDVVVDIANALASLLATNTHYDVMVSRGKTSWNPILQSYFDIHQADILSFIQSQKQQMSQHLTNGSVTESDNQVQHNTTPLPAAIQLYGINKWAAESNIDIVIHIHINDYARRSRAGKYVGFAVYVPDHQYSNATASIALGKSIAARLSDYQATSTLPKEDVGVVEDQGLIAVGSNNTADSAALLIEYGYIYEPQFQNASVRPVAVADYAYKTYLGLQDFFKDSVTPTYGSIAIPYDWDSVTISNGAIGPGIYGLQAGLRHLGFYPPAGKSFSDCPISGVVGPCTKTALVAFQSAHNLPATGTFGPQTRSALEKDLKVP